MEQKKWHYSTPSDSGLGLQLTSYLQEVQRVNTSAAQLVAELGASDAVPDMSSEAGGIIAFYFPKTILPKEIWGYETDGKDRLYYPKVTMDYQVIPEERAVPGNIQQIKKGKTAFALGITDSIPKCFQEVRHLITFRQAAEYADIKVHHKDAPSLLTKDKNSAEYKEAEKDILSVENALKTKNFYLRTTFIGHPSAIDIQRKMMALPVIPAFTLQSILQQKSAPNDSLITPSITSKGNLFLITSSSPCLHKDLIELQ